MQEAIFEQKETTAELSELSNLSFKNCPNKCIDGYYIDPYKHKKILCPYCAEKRKSLAKHSVELKDDKDLGKILRLMPTFEGLGNCNIDNILMRKSKSLDEPSYNRVVEKLQEILNKVSVGETPEESLMFNMGDSANWNSYIDAYLVRSYMSGLTTAPFLFIDDLVLSKRFYDYGLERDDVISYSTIINSDTCIVFIDSGVTAVGVYAIKGLMEIRARYNKSTILFLKSFNPELKGIINSLKSYGECRYDLVNDYMIIYRKNEKEEVTENTGSSTPVAPKPNVNARMGITGNEFNQLFAPRNSL